MLATASAQVCVPLGHSSLYFSLQQFHDFINGSASVDGCCHDPSAGPPDKQTTAVVRRLSSLLNFTAVAEL